MKHANQWCGIQSSVQVVPPSEPIALTVETVRQIQRDALFHAANIASKCGALCGKGKDELSDEEMWTSDGCYQAESAILLEISKI